MNGYAAVSLEDSMAYVSCVYINNKYQGIGAGTKLMAALEKDEISPKAGKMFLHANLTASTFYKKLGFHSDKRIISILISNSSLQSFIFVKTRH